MLVHEGQAISGHYWSYVYNRQSKRWLKFNDICVSEASWAEVVRESEGGSGTASAYCLIYVQDSSTSPTTHPLQSTGAVNVVSPVGNLYKNMCIIYNLYHEHSHYIIAFLSNHLFLHFYKSELPKIFISVHNVKEFY